MIYIMRGLPGSGKSRWVSNLESRHKVEIFSADNYHITNGVYLFDPKRSGYAHNQCFKCYMSALIVEKQTDYFVVDNTNTTVMELAPYVRVAEAFEMDYEIVYIDCPPSLATKRNLHQVPADVVVKMFSNLITEKIPPYWKQRVLFQEML